MMEYLGISTTFKDEARWLAEWIAFHWNMGVRLFYLADHGSTDNWQEAIHPFRDFIHLESWPEENVWPARHIESCNWWKGRARWVSFTNIDEFIIPERHGQTAIEHLHAFDGVSAVGIFWMFFGSNGHLIHPADKLAVEAYTTRPHELFGANSHIKTIIHPSVQQMWCDPHFQKGTLTYDMNWGIIPSANGGTITFDRLALYHLFTKSRTDWNAKVARGGGDGTRRHPDEFYAYDSRQVTDTRLAAYGPAIRATMRYFGVKRIPGE